MYVKPRLKAQRREKPCSSRSSRQHHRRSSLRISVLRWPMTTCSTTLKVQGQGVKRGQWRNVIWIRSTEWLWSPSQILKVCISTSCNCNRVRNVVVVEIIAVMFVLYFTLALSAAYTTWGVAGRKRCLSAARWNAWAGGMLYRDSVSLPPLIQVFSLFVFCSKDKSTAGLLGLSQFQFHQSPVSQERFGVTRTGLFDMCKSPLLLFLMLSGIALLHVATTTVLLILVLFTFFIYSYSTFGFYFFLFLVLIFLSTYLC